MSVPQVSGFMQDHSWIIWIPMIGSFVTMGGVYWKRHQHPANLILLGLFTIFEAMLVGTITSFYESKIVSMSLWSQGDMLTTGLTGLIYHVGNLCRFDALHFPD
jgi:FtsH-binding integral membrane protein